LEKRWWPNSPSFKDILEDILYKMQLEIIVNQKLAKFFPMNAIQTFVDEKFFKAPKIYFYRIWEEFGREHSVS
jgi:hypothetical protein